MKREELRLELPASAKYILPLRLFLAGVAVRMDFTVETIEDIKMAAAEASAILLAGCESGRLVCLVKEEEEGMRFSISSEGGKPGEEEGISRAILEAVAEECEFFLEDGLYKRIEVFFQL